MGLCLIKNISTIYIYRKEKFFKQKKKKGNNSIIVLDTDKPQNLPETINIWHDYPAKLIDQHEEEPVQQLNALS